MTGFFDSPDAMIMLTGALVGVAAALLGTFLILRGSAMLSDAISHSIVFGIIIVWMLTGQTSGPLQIIGAALTGLLTVTLTQLLVRSKKVKADAAIGLVFPALFSMGILLINIFARDVHIDEHTVLLGEIGFVWLDTFEIGGVLVPEAVVWMSLVTLANLAFVTLLYKELKLTIFDAALASALGFMPALLTYGLMALLSMTAVAAFDSVGAILFIAFVIVPPATAYLLTERLGVMLATGCAIAIASAISGYGLAVVFNVSISGMMALMTGVFFTFALVFSPRQGLIARQIRAAARSGTNASRTLAIHLFNHENDPNADEESLVAALRDHLHWSAAKADRTLLKSLDDGLVTRANGRLHLTEKGRATAREILEPWAHRALPNKDPGDPAGINVR